MKLVDIAESANVTRWHSANCHRYPSIAEHSYLVTMYAKVLLKAIVPNASIEDELLVTNHALHHDLAETVSGDLATPFKRMLEKMCSEQGMGNPIEEIEDKLCPEAKNARDNCSDMHLIIVKLADIMDAAKFISIEGKGAAAPKILLERKSAYNAYIEKGLRNFPEHNWMAAHNLLESILNESPTEIDFVEIFN